MKHLHPKLAILITLLALSLFLSIKFSQATVINKSNSSNTLLNGLVAWWTFDGMDVTAVTTTDKSNNGNDGTRRFGVGVATGKIGQAMKFDGVDDAVYLPITSTISFVAGSSFTLSSWVKTATGTAQRLIARYEGAPYYNISIGGDCTANKACLAIRGSGGGEPIVKSTSNVNDNKWHLITGVRDVAADKIYLYFDGVREATLADSSVGDFGTSYGVLLGCHATLNCTGLWLNGLMDDARIYNRALSGAEVAELFTKGGGKINKTDLTRAALRSGLVGHWTMDGREVTATGVTDKSGNGNNGTRTAGTKRVFGKIGQGLRFNGTSDVVTIPHSSTLDNGGPTTSSFSVAMWVRPEDTDSWQGLFVKDTSGPYRYVFALSDNGTTYLPAFFSTAGSVWRYANTAQPYGRWAHLVIVYNTSSLTFYVNGLSDGTVAVTNAISSSNLLIGSWSGGYWFKGVVDDIRLYNRMLSPAEIQGFYNMGGGKINKSNSGNSLKTGLTEWWTFDGKDLTTTTSTDKSGSGDHGARTGTKATIGKIGQALQFNGTSDIMSSTLNGFPSAATADVTVSFWAKPQNSSSDQTFILIAQTDEAANRLSITLPYANVIYWDFGSSNSPGRLNVTMQAGWYNTMAFWTFTSQTGVGQKIYRNGVIIASDTDTASFTKGAKTLNIGARLASADPWKGILDDLRIYSRALSTAEVVQLYRMGK